MALLNLFNSSSIAMRLLLIAFKVKYFLAWANEGARPKEREQTAATALAQWWLLVFLAMLDSRKIRHI